MSAPASLGAPPADLLTFDADVCGWSTGADAPEAWLIGKLPADDVTAASDRLPGRHSHWDPAHFAWDPSTFEAHSALLLAPDGAQAAQDASAASENLFDDPGPPQPVPGAPRRRVCRVPLCGAVVRRAYNVRVKVCAAHVVADSVVTAEGPARFCQRCHVFHNLSAFTGANHSCMHSLKLSKARRDATAIATAAARSLLIDMPGASFEEWQAAVAGITSSATLAAATLCGSGEGAAALLADAATQLEPVTCRVKLPEAADPLALPPALALRASLACCMTPAAPLTVGIAPGCVLLSVDALCEAAAVDDRASQTQAQRLACALQETGFAAHPAAAGGYVLAGGTRAALRARAAAQHHATPLELPLPPRAVALDGAGEWVEVPCALAGTPSVAWAARCAGQALAVQTVTGFLCLSRSQLRALGGQGCVLLTAAPAGAVADTEPLRSEPRALLVCASAALAAQLDVVLQSSGSADAAAQRLLRVIGDALRPQAAPRVRLAAAAAAAWLGSDLLITELLALAAAESSASGADVAMDLALEARRHAVQAMRAGRPSAASVASAASTLVSPTAWQMASDLVFEATSNGHARPEAAAQAALDRAAALGDQGAVRVLRALRCGVQQQQLEPLELALAETDASAASLLFLLLAAMPAWYVSALLPMQRVTLMLLALRCDWKSGWPPRLTNIALARKTILWPAAGGDAIAVELSDSREIVRGMRLYCLLGWIPYTGACLAILMQLRRLRLCRSVHHAAAFQRGLFGAVAVCTLAHLAQEVGLLYYTGCVPEFPLVLKLIAAANLAFFHLQAPLDLPHTYAMLLLQLVASTGAVILSGRLALLARPAWVVYLLAIGGSTALAPRRAAAHHARFLAARAASKADGKEE